MAKKRENSQVPDWLTEGNTVIVSRGGEMNGNPFGEEEDVFSFLHVWSEALWRCPRRGVH